MEEQQEEIKAILESDQQPELEEQLEVEASPLNEPVQTNNDKQVLDDENWYDNDPVELSEEDLKEEEKEIEDSVEMPDSHAAIAADTFLGVANNLFEIGGGFFVKVQKTEELYQFEEVVQLIDEHNERNVERIKLDEEDMLLLRPLLMMVIKKRAKNLTPEQQLTAAVLSILLKKVKTVAEIRRENTVLLQKIMGLISEHRSDEVAETKEVKSTPEESILEVAETESGS